MDATAAALVEIVKLLVLKDLILALPTVGIVYFLVFILYRRASSGGGVSGPVVPAPGPTPVPLPPIAPPPGPATGHPELAIGDVGPDVAVLQQLLGVTADGEFGPDTDATVRAYQASHGLDPDGVAGVDTWASLVSGKPAAPQADGIAISSDVVAKIIQAAASSAVAHLSWSSRGAAPIGYVKGIAVAFGNVYAKSKQGDSAAAVMASALGDSSIDALSWYEAAFTALGMTNAGGPDTLRHLFVLLTGLGMRESSGRYCEGRDMSASNVTADTAEAGLFQQSWNSRVASPELPKLFARYSANPQGFLSVFAEGVTPKSGDITNYGSGDGAAFQALCKSCPAFAVEAAAVGLRTIRKHWGPIIRQEAELRPEVDQLLHQVQEIVDAAPMPATKPAPVSQVPAGDSTPWLTLARTYDGLIWDKGNNPMPPTIVAWMNTIAKTFPDMMLYVNGLKESGAASWWPWCGAFIQAMLAPYNIRGPITSAEIDNGTQTVHGWAYATSWVNFGEKVWMPEDGPIENANPKPGDVLVFKGHVTFYDHLQPTTSTFSCTGGDQGSPLRVCTENIGMSGCIAIRRPVKS